MVRFGGFPNKRFMRWVPAVVAFISILSVIYWINYPVLSFTFWKDDWYFLLLSLTDPGKLMGAWIHPGTIAEFYVFGRLFGSDPLAWMHIGLLLRAIVSFGISVVLQSVTSPVIALFAGFLYAVGPFGLEVNGWPSGHVVLVSAVFFLFGLRLFIEDNGTHFGRSIFGTALIALSLLSDPARTVVGIIAVLMVIATWQANKKRIVALVAITVIIVVALLFNTFTIGKLSEAFGAFSTNERSAKLMLAPFGTFFADYYQLSIGWLYHTEHGITEEGHAYYRKHHSRIGFVLMAVFGLWSIYRLRLRRDYVPLLLLVWQIGFLVPSWLFNTDLVISPVHRYMVLPAIGYVMFLTLLLFEIKHTYIRFFVITGLIVFASYLSWTRYSHYTQYREAMRVHEIYDAIIEKTRDVGGRAVIVVKGDDPLLTNLFFIHGSAWYSIRAGEHSQPTSIVMYRNESDASAHFCLEKKKASDSSRYFLFSIAGTGEVDDKSSELRKGITSFPCQ